MEVSYDSGADDDTLGMIHDVMCFPSLGFCLPNNHLLENEHNKGSNDKTSDIYKLFEEAESHFYLGCENFM